MKMPPGFCLFASVLVLVLLSTCGKKSVPAPVLVFHGDTLTRDQVAALDPVAGSDTLHYRNVGIRLQLAGSLSGVNADDAVMQQCREQLALYSGLDWSDSAAALLLRAADSLTGSFSTLRSCEEIRKKTDSLSRYVQTGMLKPPGTPLPFKLSCDSLDPQTAEGKLRLIGAVLGVSAELAKLLAEFTVQEDTVQSLAGDAVKSMINGLVSSGTDKKVPAAEAAERNPVPIVKKKPVDNSAMALRFRDQKSIRDSIEKHIPNLKQLYKKSLKSGSGFSGNVIVTMRVGAGGEVLKAVVKSSEIRNRNFINPFIAYLKTIRFLPIPDKVGAMTFDFPFEFNEEL